MELSMHKMIHLFKRVQDFLDVTGWSLRFARGAAGHEGYCWHETKVIDVGIDSPGYDILLLHEMAHIRTGRFCNNAHDWTFWREFEEIRRRFRRFPSQLDLDGARRDYQNVGFYRLCYKRW